MAWKDRAGGYKGCILPNPVSQTIIFSLPSSLSTIFNLPHSPTSQHLQLDQSLWPYFQNTELTPIQTQVSSFVSLPAVEEILDLDLAE